MTQQQKQIKTVPLTEEEIDMILNTPEFGVLSDDEVQMIKEAEKEFYDDIIYCEDITKYSLKMTDVFDNINLLNS